MGDARFEAIGVYIIFCCQRLAVIIICATNWSHRMTPAMLSQRAGKPGEGARKRGPSEAGARACPTMVDVANEARGFPDDGVVGARITPTAHGCRRRRASGAIKAAAKLGYRPPGRRGDAPLSRASTIGFICDEISTDPWTSIGFDGVREKAWERGLAVHGRGNARRRRHGSGRARARWLHSHCSD